jgi:2-iminobutanoate/2-iminopropanoate deaminase
MQSKVSAGARRAIVPANRRDAPARAYSPGITFGDLVFSSGLSAADPVSGTVPEGIEAQTRRCFDKLDEILRTANSSLQLVLRVTVYVTDIQAHHAPMTAVFREVFPGSEPPTRTTVQVAALSSPDKLVEIDAIAARRP